MGRPDYDGAVDEVAAFYDELADAYTAIFADWDASVLRQAEIIDTVIRAEAPAGVRTVLDATCGIGTQAIGLALRGYDVTATDLSAASVERARLEAARFGASIAFGVGDVRNLADAAAGAFDVAITFDNALPHLLTPADLSMALRGFRRVLRHGGLFLASIRDYDALLATRPPGEPARMSGSPGSRCAAAQAWDWDASEPTYRLHQFVLREHTDGAWSVRHLEATYRAVTRRELAGLAEEAGFRDAHWLEPSTTRFHQPILVARNGWGGSIRWTLAGRAAMAPTADGE